MLKSLLKKYQNAIYQELSPVQVDNDFFWFTTQDENEYLGIPKNELNEAEHSLLVCLFKEVTMNEHLFQPHPESVKWFDYLYRGSETLPNEEHRDFRSIHFSLEGEIDLVALSEAMQHLFANDCIIIFKNHFSGVVLENLSSSLTSKEELLSAAKVIEADFYVSPSFFIGQSRTVNNEFSSGFHEEEKMFLFAKEQFQAKRIFSIESISSYYIVQFAPKELRDSLFGSIFSVFSEDEIVLKTIKTFLENQLNTSQTAKELYMHRNSVQYRIDRFMEKTKIDLKSFEGSLFVYFACLEYESSRVHKKQS